MDIEVIGEDKFGEPAYRKLFEDTMSDLNKAVLIEKAKLVLKPSVPLFIFSIVLKADPGDKTVVVLVERRYRHPLYGKELTERKKFHAHDEANRAKVGDKVRIEECRPLSRMKRWRLVEIESASAEETK